MRLFTSSFDMKFILNCILICLGFVFLYTIIVIKIPKDLNGANQWQTNVIKAQEFTFTDKQYKYIMVGSSMAYNIPIEKLSKEAFNLAFASGCSLTGIEIINAKLVDKETIVLIEANSTIMRGSDDKFVSKTNIIYGSMPFLQNINRPDVLMVQSLKKIKRFFKAEIVDNYKDLDKPIANELIRHQSSNDILIFQEDLDRKIDELYVQVSELEKKGIKVIFFEPPMDYSLYALKRTVQVRESLLKKFPPSEFDWIPNNWDKFKTKDGIHLDKNSAKRYASELLEYVVQQKLGWKPKTTLQELCSMMVREDLVAAKRDVLLDKHGFEVHQYNE